MDCSLPSFSVHGILQARILESVAVPFSRGSSNPGTEPRSPTLQEDSLPAELPGKPDLNGKEIQKGGDIGIYLADSLSRTAETDTALQSNYPLMKMFKHKVYESFSSEFCDIT